MRLLMDADCLIKLVKAGLKESVLAHDTVVIPEVVKKEVVDAGKEKGHPDAALVEKNIAAKRLQVVGRASSAATGDEALLKTFQTGKYDAAATDDRKLIRLLKAAGVPFVLPAMILLLLRQRKLLDRETALRTLDQLSHFISDEEYSTVKLLLEEKG
jgi:rRNA-processing protein FCF1